jgi:hypothetical protein
MTISMNKYGHDGRAYGPSLWGINFVAAGVTYFMTRSCDCVSCWNSRRPTSFYYTTCVLVNG